MGKVFGTSHLYVVDAGIAPLEIDGNPNTMVEMMAWVIGNHLLSSY